MTDSLRAEVERFDSKLRLEAAHSPPSSWYVDSAVAQLERTAVFARHWLFACPSDHVAKPGSWVSGRQAGLLWVVVRDEEGVLRAFHNVCRHRAAEVVRGRGCGELVCRYHAWRYRLDGRLRSAPRAGAMQDFDRDLMSLTPLAVEQWGPLVLLHADPEAPPFAPGHAELEERLTASGWTDLSWVARRSYEVCCNWKVFNDNYLDGGYHIRHMHPSLDAQIDMSAYRTELLEGASVQSCPPSSSAASVSVAARMGEGALYAWIHPTLMINRYGPVLDTNTVVPLAPDRCLVHFDFWFASDADESGEFVKRSMAQSHITQLEDIDISESVQLGTDSTGFHRGRYAPNYEKAIHHFHRLLSADLLDGLAAHP